MILERVLGSRAKVALLGALFVRDGRTGRALAAEAGVSASTGKAALEDLEAAGLVLQSGTPGRHQYELNRSHGVCALLEALVDFDRSVPRRVADRVRRSVGPRALRGVSIEDGTVSLHGTAALALDRVAHERLGRMLFTSFGLCLVSVSTDGTAPAPGPGRWVAGGPAEVGPPREPSRDSVLGFFGLDDRCRSEDPPK